MPFDFENLKAYHDAKALNKNVLHFVKNNKHIYVEHLYSPIRTNERYVYLFSTPKAAATVTLPACGIVRIRKKLPQQLKGRLGSVKRMGSGSS